MSAPNPASELGMDGPVAVRPRWAWLPEGWVEAPVLAWDGDGRLTDPTGLPARDLPGVVLPGLVNAHVHLELAPVVFPPACGLPAWVPIVRAGPPASAARAGQSVYAAIRAGTAGVGEISNTGLSGPAGAAARLPGRYWREVLGIDVDTLPEGELAAHGPHTVHPTALQAIAARGGPWSVHFDEDPAEAAFLRGEGPWVAFMRAIGRDLGRFPFPHTSPARYLAELGVLGPKALLVHATLTRGADLDLIAASGARVCLCVRSNLALTGRLPDVPGLLDRGVPLAVGTDSLASVPDLDPFAELAALRRAFPELPAATWLAAATSGGADALDLPLGRLAPGAAPGVLHAQVDHPDALFAGTPFTRRWLACPRA